MAWSCGGRGQGSSLPPSLSLSLPIFSFCRQLTVISLLRHHHPMKTKEMDAPPEKAHGLHDPELSKPTLEHLHAIDDPDLGLSEEEKATLDRRLLRKLDRRLIPWLSLLYLASFLDRTNIGNAKLEGLQTALHMSNAQYNASLTVFFVSYSVFEPLTNVLLKRTRPSLFIPTILVLWGICMTTMGLVHNYGGLLTARWFLGLAEAGLFPGISYYLSCWYRRAEFGIRMAVFFSAAALAGSFGGLLAAAIAQMDGVGGKEGWAWIFILEGLATVVLGAMSYWLVYDFPDRAAFLSEAERKRVLRRLAADTQGSGAREQQFKSAYVWASLQDSKTWLGCVIYMGADGALYAFSLFVPTIINGLGYSSTRAQLLSVPPYACAAILTVTIGYLADRTRQRGLYNIVVSLVGIAGFIMLLAAESAGVQYAGVFLGAMGIYPCIANTISWVSNNVEGAPVPCHPSTQFLIIPEGVYKRGITLGLMIGWGNLNGIVSSNIYRTEDAPRFYPGHGVVLGYLVVFLLGGSVVQYLLLRRENRRRVRGERDYRLEGLGAEEVEELGDQRPGFLYTFCDEIDDLVWVYIGSFETLEATGARAGEDKAIPVIILPSLTRRAGQGYVHSLFTWGLQAEFFIYFDSYYKENPDRWEAHNISSCQGYLTRCFWRLHREKKDNRRK
ncbi:MFS general substrate transporter [Aspergillus saccharolyticus JOP 1030-1]|uniref:MFS general substrate transporter n=1 Tax=Aspergillus saccharolyticus JOP 1030-1 TaxID=1450539 RepID=A0A318Z920_9EURO|nr:MFS general substrate transporter [Aspergillus saccharolyticus JOP 1030-1]PYH42884.1 MFS general substrate transporter [Aspergillus saccharolyticus JOP 1030-1]